MSDDELSVLELQRRTNIADNERQIELLGLHTAKPPPPPPRPRKRKPPPLPTEQRASARLAESDRRPEYFESPERRRSRAHAPHAASAAANGSRSAAVETLASETKEPTAAERAAQAAAERMNQSSEGFTVTLEPNGIEVRAIIPSAPARAPRCNGAACRLPC
jgi:type IV secretory pathway VirB10-like protein